MASGVSSLRGDLSVTSLPSPPELGCVLPGASISSIHGRARKINGRICVAMYHPAAGLHQASLRSTIVEDFKKVKQALAEAERLQETDKPKPQDDQPQQLSLF